jgi:GT2 family glycosyltransferase
MLRKPSQTVLAIPVKDEEAAIGHALRALARQTVAFDHIVLLLNNCTDGTLAVCEAARAALPNLRIVQCMLPPAIASAGEARRLALDHAAALAGPEGIIFTSDADAVPAPDWQEKNLREFARGADAVCGAAMMDPADEARLRPGLRFDDLREVFLLRLLDEIRALLDPDPADPWPRHQQESGASIAMRAGIFAQAGGAPRVASGEDRALIECLRRVDARIRHAPEITIRVSGRVEGRAAGGMAETIRRRIRRQDALTDDKLEPAVDAYRRAIAKSRLRAGDPSLATDLLMHPSDMARALEKPYFGAAWAEVQRLSPVLHRRRVAYADLARETRQALALRDQLQAELEVRLAV